MALRYLTANAGSLFLIYGWFEANQEEFTRYSCEQSFARPEEAEMQGIAAIRKWIDDDKPEPK